MGWAGGGNGPDVMTEGTGDSAFNAPSMDPNSIDGAQSSTDQTLGSGNWDPYSAFGGGSSADQTLGSGNWDPYGAGAGAMDYSVPQPDFSTPDMQQYTQPDQSPSQSSGGSYGGGGYGGGGYGGYARGGGVLPHGNGTSGGFVPRSASPSRGAQTDDIPARLNAREFVIPQDVADWKGQEFFQKLIEQSRKARSSPQGAPAQGQQKPPLANMQHPTFVSRKLPPPSRGQIPMPGAQRMGAQ